MLLKQFNYLCNMNEKEFDKGFRNLFIALAIILVFIYLKK